MYGGIADPGRFEAAVRSGGARPVTVTFTDVANGGQPLTLRALSGEVVDSATSNTRRTLSLTLPNRQTTWDLLNTIGGEFAVTATNAYTGGGKQDVPMGRFVLQQDELDYNGDGNITINQAPDRWGGRVAPATLPQNQRASVRTNTVAQEVKRLVEGAFTAAFPFPGWASFDTSVGTAKVGALLWDDGNRETALLDMLRTIGAQVLFDRTGLAVFRAVPVLTTNSVPVFTVNAGVNGVLVGASRSRDRSRIRNAVAARTSASDVTFTPQVVANTTVGDPLSTNGYLGYREEPLEGNFRNSAQARAAAKVRLAQTLGVAQQVSLTAFRHFGLDSEDVIKVIYPKTDRNLPRPDEQHILDTVTTPLLPGTTQSLENRSTRPDTDGS